jgi:hypothetical protein
MQWVDEVFHLGEPLRAFDFYIHMLSLPKAFRTEISTIPGNVPYLSPKEEYLEKWKNLQLSANTINVGIVWAGDPGNLRNSFRSIVPDALRPLACVRGVRFFSLQKGMTATCGPAVFEPTQFVDLSSEIHDFADTAAIVTKLDLVITVCTSVAHLTGALGKPVWVLLAKPADWRWLEGRNDSPWYPTMRLFRQTRQGDWSSAIEDVVTALRDMASVGTATFIASCPSASSGSKQSEVHVAVGMPTDICRVMHTRVGLLQYPDCSSDMVRSLRWYGEYLHSQLESVADMFSVNSVVVEIASGIGAATLWLVSVIGKEGHLFSYESRPEYQAPLRNNLTINEAANVTLLRPCSGDDDIVGADSSSAAGESVSVDSLQLPPFEWLVVQEGVDVGSVVGNSVESFWEYRPRVFISSVRRDGLRVIGSVMQKCDYECWVMEASLFDPANFNQRDTDIFDGARTLSFIALPRELHIDLESRKWVALGATKDDVAAECSR